MVVETDRERHTEPGKAMTHSPGQDVPLVQAAQHPMQVALWAELCDNPVGVYSLHGRKVGQLGSTG